MQSRATEAARAPSARPRAAEPGRLGPIIADRRGRGPRALVAIVFLALLQRASSAFTTTGTCSASGDCVSSPNYPSEYGNGESCTITPQMSGVLSVTSFSTEASFDHLTIDGSEYDGTTGPDGVSVSPSTSMSWTSDGSNTDTGWQLCLVPIETEFMITPPELVVTQGKPGIATTTCFIVNSGDYDLNASVAAASVPAGLNFSTTGNFKTVSKGGYAEVGLEFTTARLEAKTHQIKLIVTCNTARTRPRTQALNVSLRVDAPADRSTSTVSVGGMPVLGYKYNDILITARDSDGLEIQIDTGADFGARLKTPDGGLSVQCGITWSDDELAYQATCSLPKLDQAGEWFIVPSLDGDDFDEPHPIRMQCPAGEFEDKDTKCKPCPKGADCWKPGITLGTLPIEEGYWRASSTSSKVHECVLGPSACRGSLKTENSSKELYTNSTDYCHEGYEGPICSTCSHEYFKNWVRHTCNLCAGMAKTAPVIVPLIVIGAVAFLVSVWALCKRFASRDCLRGVIGQAEELTQRILRMYGAYKNKMKITVYGASQLLSRAHSHFPHNPFRRAQCCKSSTSSRTSLRTTTRRPSTPSPPSQ